MNSSSPPQTIPIARRLTPAQEDLTACLCALNEQHLTFRLWAGALGEKLDRLAALAESQGDGSLAEKLANTARLEAAVAENLLDAWRAEANRQWARATGLAA
jgi:hypothetical protein